MGVFVLAALAASAAASTTVTASVNITTSTVSALNTTTFSVSENITSSLSASVSSVSSFSSFSPSISSITISPSISSTFSISPSIASTSTPPTITATATAAATGTAETTLGTPGSLLPISSQTTLIYPSNNASAPQPTQSGTFPGGYAVQPPFDPAATHTFSPFPSPTQPSIPGIFPATDPLSPPPVSSDPQLIPDFNDAWTNAWSKAARLITTFSLEEKVNITTGVGWMNGRCVGNTPPVPVDGSGVWKGLCLEDSPLGVRDTDFATVFPAGINAASTFSRRLIRLRGLGMGQEHRGKGVNIALGPMTNMGRIAQGGRNWEGFGADPYLSGEATYETILGMQQGGVQACVKHYVNNEQENQRTMESSNVDDRTEHEIYTHPFMRAVMAGVASVMCSYNQINETYACSNDRTMNQILKSEFGFRGFIMSDWSATEETAGAFFGLDMTMPGDITFSSGTSYFGGNLTAYVSNSSIPLSRLDDMATRIVAAWYFLHQDDSDYPSVNFNAFNPVDESTNEHVDVQDDHDKTVREIGAASTVLLKNVNCTLPLKSPRSIFLAGSDAGPSPGGPNQFSDGGGDAGILAMGWGSGTANFTYLISPLEAIQRRARQDRTSLNWNLNDFALATIGNQAIQSTHAIVFINSDSGEGYITVDGNAGDRKNLTAWHGGDALVLAVAAQNKNTIVVVHSVGPLIIEPWIDHPNVTAVLWAGLGGPETGNALVDILYGTVTPSGRLPYTIAKSASDYGTTLTLGGAANEILQIPYTEGLFFDYRRFDHFNITPRFEFGFGLSYTTFEYEGLGVVKVESGVPGDEALVKGWEEGKVAPGSQSVGASTALWLHEPAYNVTFQIKNTGDVCGTEIPQLYINLPASAQSPPSVLKGFTDTYLKPGERTTVTLTLSRYDLSVWDVVAQAWVRPKGTIGFTVGASSRDHRLFGKIPA